MPRHPVTQARLEQFLRRLGLAFHGHGRLYLVGGAQMVQAGFRAQTVDIDYTVYLSPEQQQPFAVAMRTVSHELDVNVEPVGPGDFIPLPRGWEDRSPYLARYGGLDVFAFDPVAMALAKIERGADRDINDVLALLRAGQLNLVELNAAFDEIAPRLEAESLRVDEDDFRRKLTAFMKLAIGEATDDIPPGNRA